MSLADKVSIDIHYTRSINLERDAGSLEVLQAYIPTTRARQTLARVMESWGAKQAPRAWSLIGPYGSGKSSFSIFLSHLLGDPAAETTRTAFNSLTKVDKPLSQAFRKHTKDTAGYLKVMLTGSPEPLSNRFISALAEAATSYWSQLRGPNNAVVAKLQKAAKKKSLSHSDILALLREVQNALNGKTSGILIVIDELGKFLEYEARHYDANDIFLLQTLAEYGCGKHEVNILTFVLLHQSFEQYAKGLGDSLRQEWAKIQGRYEDIPFLESVEQTLRIVSSAFNIQLSKNEHDDLNLRLSSIAKRLSDQAALPGALAADEASELFANCYPLHPLSALILPMLCQKVAQNERTLFSYLGSQEPYGFRSVLEGLGSVDEYIEPRHIYDYFIQNQPAAIADHLTHRRWVEVITAIERLGDAPEEQINFLKTIGLLNIIGSQGGLKASGQVLETVFHSKAKVGSIADALIKKSVIQYRKFNSEYRVWQGSDFDIDQALQSEKSRLGNFPLPEKLNQRAKILPIIARRYTIKNGALRYFEPLFVDAQNFNTVPSAAQNPRVIFFLAADKGDTQVFFDAVMAHFSRLDMLALCSNGPQLRDIIAEVLALNQVRIHYQELNSDPIAQREFRDRLEAAELAEENILRTFVDAPESLGWFWKGQKCEVISKRAFQNELSTILENVYSKSPVFHNELINRDKPSSQAAAARNKLLAAMLHNAEEKDLGFEKFPAEKAIYRALLYSSGLHRELKLGEWGWAEPKSNKKIDDPCKLWPAWQRIVAFMESTESQRRSFSELSDELMIPPYGIKDGILPILYFAAYLVYKNEVAWYENQDYQPYLTAEHLERFVKRPQDFSIQYFKLKGLRASLFSQYNKALYGAEDVGAKGTKQRTLLELVRPLATFMAELELYTQKTKRLSDKAQALRNAFNLSKSPVKLIFEDIPRALGFAALDTNTDQDVKGLAEALIQTLRELKYSYVKLLEREQQLLANAFDQRTDLPLAELRRNIAGRVAGLEEYTVDVEGIRAFIQRLQKIQDTDSHWLENVLMFLGHKPTNKWLDIDQDSAEYRLTEFSKRIKDLEKLRIHFEGEKAKQSNDFDVFLLRSLKKGERDYDEVVTINRDRADAIKEVKQNIADHLAQLDDKELKLAALAEIVNDFLAKYRLDSSVKKASKIHNRKLA